MSEQNNAERLARLWIDLWNRNRPDDLPLAEAFVHTSPFGRVAGKKKYLDWVKPLAKQNVTELTVHKTLARGNEAVIQFEMQTPAGPIEVCDWVTVEGESITEIHSFYDATGLRGQ